MNSNFQSLRFCFLMLTFVLTQSLKAQQNIPGAPITLQNAPQKDTTKKANTSDWKDEPTRIFYRHWNSRKILMLDTSLHAFHRSVFYQNGQRNLGNLGAPIVNLIFQPTERTGPSLGYTVFDTYFNNLDSLKYFNTTRPYSMFGYHLGSKAEQLAELVHTQNIKPNWNFGVQYYRLTSTGYYRIQRNNHDIANFTTNYESSNKQYKINAAIIYNKLQHDENGGITNDSFLTQTTYSDRATIPVLFQNDEYSIRRSSVTNMQRKFQLAINQNYTWGKRDTIYSADSINISNKFTPHFSLGHKMIIHAEKLQFKDLQPDSLRYSSLFQHNFSSGDSLMMEQTWNYVDQSVSLNGYLGAIEQQVLFSLGAGMRFDLFETNFITAKESSDNWSQYLLGNFRKESLMPGQWQYEGKALLFLTGNTSGNTALEMAIGKDLGNEKGFVNLGFKQKINNAPYNFTLFKNPFYEQRNSFDKESLTSFFASINWTKWRMSAELTSYLIANYFYLNENQLLKQYAPTFNLSQLVVNKQWQKGKWVLDNQLVFQWKKENAPINVPNVLGRHQLSYESGVFGNALKIATGLDCRWHTAYESAGYNPFFNRFFYSNQYVLNNIPEIGAFFNFKIKSFRAYFMMDQLQQLFVDKNVIVVPGYPMQNALFRFGFNWVMIN